jgi:hypothetical protein
MSNRIIPPNLRNERMMHQLILNEVISQTKHPLVSINMRNGIILLNLWGVWLRNDLVHRSSPQSSLFVWFME